MSNKKSYILILTISGSIMFLSKCINNVQTGNDPRGNVYIGSSSCRQCHQSIYDAYINTSHYNTTQSSSEKNVLGSFKPGQNEYAYSSEAKIVMEHRDSGLFQVLFVNGKKQQAHRLDITFGIKHAQTYLSWQGNQPFELPVSYYTSVNTWASSPGFPSTEVLFNRSIGKECYECHSSFIESKLTQTAKGIDEVFEKKTLITGIDCERCHGPAINHVNYHLAYPDEKIAKYIITTKSLSRQQKLDACAVCHSGNDKQKEISSFNFKMGDTLANFFSPFVSSRHKSNSDFDVHGNQYQLLSESKCFLKSKTLDCSSCHSPHTNASTDLTEYSNKCVTCHKDSDHSSLKMDEATAASIKSNCIDCHMPKQPSQAITFQLAGSNIKSVYLLRTHKIAVYRDVKMNEVLQYFKKNKTI